jgi:hypothetical protein
VESRNAQSVNNQLAIFGYHLDYQEFCNCKRMDAHFAAPFVSVPQKRTKDYKVQVRIGTGRLRSSYLETNLKKVLICQQ